MYDFKEFFAGDFVEHIFEVKQEECVGWCLVVPKGISYPPFHPELCGSSDKFQSIFDYYDIVEGEDVLANWLLLF